MLTRLIFVSLVLFVPAIGAGHADIPNTSRIAIEEAIAPHAATGGAIGECSIVYYNLCRWLWVHSGFRPGDEVGVVFDLPLDCGEPTNGPFQNTSFWWYWRYTAPARGYTVSYGLYELDPQWCKQGTPQGTLAHHDPTERWNHLAGLGGWITSDYASIVASWDHGALPYMATDNNVKNLTDATHCPGYVAHTLVHSVTWKHGLTSYCPPVAFTDAAGPVEIVMDAAFYCLGDDATHPESWTGVKRLFR